MENNEMIEISKELKDRLDKEREEMGKTIGIPFNYEECIWELFKICKLNKEED